MVIRRVRKVRQAGWSSGSRALHRGGKGALRGDGLASDPQGGGEADPVGVVAAVCGGLGHQGADGVVAAQVAPDLLEHQVR